MSQDLQRQVDELVALVTANRAAIDHLTARADASESRAAATDATSDLDRTHIDALASRADETVVRADLAERRADQEEARVDRLEVFTTEDREMIAELQADDAVSRAHIDQLERALSSSRTIGTAIGILMASRDIDRNSALTVLKEASSRSNVPIRQLAETIVDGIRPS